VRRGARSLGGRVSVTTHAGQLTSFRLTLPLTLAIAEALVVRVGMERFIVPITSVVELLRPTRDQVSTVCEKGEVIGVRGEHLRLIRLAQFIEKPADIDQPWNAIVLIVEFGNERCGLMVDELLGQQQIVIKSLGQALRQTRGVVGGAVLGDGCVGLILDIGEIVTLSRTAATVAV
jgi:two-component system chemotaxis sensor kinase CheA